MDFKKWIVALGFTPKENTANIYSKQYPLCGGYCIDADFGKEEIAYNEIVSDSKTTQNFSQPENFVIIECVDRLLTKGYKPQNIILEKVWRSGHGTSGRLDICVTRDDGSPYLLIECKTYGKEFDKELAKTHKDGGQLFTYFQLSGGKADVIMLYASELKGKDYVFKNEIIKIEDAYRSGDAKDIYEKWNKLTKDNGIFDPWVKPYNFQSKALTKEQLKEIRSEDSSFIFNRFLEILRHNVVSDKGNAFNKIFTLFLCKVYDETSTVDGEELQFQWKEGVDTHVDFQLRLTELYSKGMQKFLERTVSDFNEDDFNKRCANLNEDTKKYLLQEVNKLRLEKNNEFAIKEVYDTPSFEENAKVVKEVVELIQGYKIRYNKRQQYLSDFFELLLTTGLKQEAGQFFTPVPIAQFIIKSLPLDEIVADRLRQKDGEILPYMIDYAAGSGHFLTEYMHEVQEIVSQSNPKDYIDSTARKVKNWQDDHFDWATQYVYGVEKDYRLVKVGKVGCYLHGDGLANVILSDGLANFSKNKEYKGKLRKDAKDTSKDNQLFDVVLSNPPYSISSFRQTTRDYYTRDNFELYDFLTDNSSEIECLFVERTKQLLKDGGVCGVILPSSILSNAGIYTKTREMILQYFDIVAIAELGSNTFMATGTNTVVLFLRRRNNYDSKNIRAAVEGYFQTFNEITINGIENPITKYVAFVWAGLDYADYLTLLQKRPNDKVKAHDIYADYRKKIRAKDETTFWKEVLALESEKLTYFIIAYPQKVVLVKSGDKEAEKRFLGYEFSNRRGSEGIHPIQRGKNIEECTQLFDTHSSDNPDKASTYIQRAFKGDYDSTIAESMQENVFRTRLVNMLTFDRADFEKSISIVGKKKVKIESKWPLVTLSRFIEVIGGGTPDTTNYGYWNGTIPWLSVVDFNNDTRYVERTEKTITEEGLKNSSAKILNAGDIIISARGTVGALAQLKIPMAFNQSCYGLRGSQDVDNGFLYYILKAEIAQLKDGSYGSIFKAITTKTFSEIKIPLPPKEIQEQIVADIEVLEKEEAKAKEKIKADKERIENVCLQVYSTYNKEKLIHLAKTNPSKTEIAHLDIDTFISFVDMSSVSNDGYIANKIDRPYSELKKGSYTYFREGDIIIAKITPCMENGKCALATDLTNGLALGSSEFHVIRPNNDKIDTKYLFILLNRKPIRIEAEKNMTGASGHRRVPIAFYESLEIPMPSLAGQQTIVSEIEALEKEIAKAKKIIDRLPEQQAEILKKYL
jgi:type I restriction enzyme M protein